MNSPDDHFFFFPSHLFRRIFRRANLLQIFLFGLVFFVVFLLLGKVRKSVSFFFPLKNELPTKNAFQVLLSLFSPFAMHALLHFQRIFMEWC